MLAPLDVRVTERRLRIVQISAREPTDALRFDFAGGVVLRSLEVALSPLYRPVEARELVKP